MRTYEPFKSEAKRLVSVTCDRCEVEMWRAPGQPAGNLDWHGFQGDQDQADRLPRVWTSGGYDLCADCLEGARATLIAYIGKEPTRGKYTPPKDKS